MKIFILLLIRNFFLVALDHVGKFQEVCDSTHLRALKHLHFSFCFPQEIEHSWRMSSFNCMNEWPFDNLAYYIDEIWTSVQDRAISIRNALFVVYKRPITLLFHQKRTFHNHCLAAHASVPSITARRRLIKWTCDVKDEPDHVMKTLRILVSGRVNQLHLTYLNEPVST